MTQEMRDRGVMGDERTWTVSICRSHNAPLFQPHNGCTCNPKGTMMGADRVEVSPAPVGDGEELVHDPGGASSGFGSLPATGQMIPSAEVEAVAREMREYAAGPYIGPVTTGRLNELADRLSPSRGAEEDSDA